MMKPRNFEIYYMHAQEYYAKNGNLLVPQKYVIEKNNEVIRLGAWINNLRVKYKKNELEDYQIELLNCIGMVWDVYEKQFMDNYELAKSYYEQFGNLLIPQEYIMIKDDQVEFPIGHWISSIRDDYDKGKLTEDRIWMLNEIGMVWDVYAYRFDFYYEVAKKYFELHGNLLVPENYEVDGIKLGSWIHAYRMAFRNQSWRQFNYSYIERLNNIGMIWDVELYRLYKTEITDNTQADIKQQLLTHFYYFLTHYSHMDFQSDKTCKYLNEQFNYSIPKVKTKSS